MVDYFFENRAHAGQALAQKLDAYATRPQTVVLALPRGGVPVAYEVAMAFNLPLDVFVVRKLGVPGHGELAMGAIATGGIRFLDEDIVQGFGVSDRQVDAVTFQERIELERREIYYRESQPMHPLTNHHIILVDDGLATGSSMKVAVMALHRFRPASITVAVPVSEIQVCYQLQPYMDHVVCLQTPEPFIAVGRWYADFRPTTDEDVRTLLHQAQQRFNDTSTTLQPH